MLIIKLQEQEFFNEELQEFETLEPVSLELEHSLVSLSKWESKFQRPFLGAEQKTPEEIFGYVEAMITTKDFPSNVFGRLRQEDLDEINDYIESKATATTFGSMPERKGPWEIITSELIYYWLIAFNIPFEVEHWHLNRLFALIRICNIKNSKPKKLSKHEIAMRNRELNNKRREQFQTKG